MTRSMNGVRLARPRADTANRPHRAAPRGPRLADDRARCHHVRSMSDQVRTAIDAPADADGHEPEEFVYGRGGLYTSYQNVGVDENAHRASRIRFSRRRASSGR